MALPQGRSRRVYVCTLAVTLMLKVAVPLAHAVPHELSCKPGVLKFGKVIAGQRATLPVTLSNRGRVAVTVPSIDITSPAFSVDNLNLPLTLGPGENVQFTVSFTPSSAGDVEGLVIFVGLAINRTLALPLEGQGVNDWGISAQPASLTFGNVPVGQKATLPLSIVNSGDSAATISSGRLLGAGFSVKGVTLPLTLDPGHSYTFDVTFAPQTGGQFSGNILATSPLSPILTVPLSGHADGAGSLIVYPAEVNFGNVTIGDRASLPAILTATGEAVTVSSANSDNSAFSISGISLPLTIQAGQSISYTVTFAPQANGAARANLSFISTALNSPTSEGLTGNGTGPAHHSVGLSWDASLSEVIGYNIYRGAASRGPYTRINTALDPDTTYVDKDIAGGQTYYYVTTAVNSVGAESGFSNEVRASIP